MEVIELMLLAVAYTGLIVSLTLGIICYKRHIESLETLAFTGSLLLLIIAFSLSPLLTSAFGTTASDVSILLCMVIVASTTLLNTLAEREHTISANLKKMHIRVSLLLFMTGFIACFTGHIRYLQWPVVLFLVSSVAGSMILIRVTKPRKIYVHLEKSNRIFAVVFLILIPLYFTLQYGFGDQYHNLKIGFILPFVFILLSTNKIYDDLKRLAVIRGLSGPGKPALTNYGLTERERQVADLLLEGASYQAICDRLFISIPTVKTHSSNIYRKCSVRNRVELLKLLSD